MVRAGPSGPFLTFPRASASGPNTAITAAAPDVPLAVIDNTLRFNIVAGKLRYFGTARILVSVMAVCAAGNLGVPPHAPGIVVTLNGAPAVAGPPVPLPGSGTATLLAVGLMSLITNDEIAFTVVVGGLDTVAINSPTLVLTPIGDGEA